MPASLPKPNPSVSIRPNSQQRQVIAQAAKLLNVSVSQFVLQRAYLDAQAVLAEQTRFGLNDQEWANFIAVLDAPPKELPRLKKLFQEPGVFDGKH